MTQPVAGLTPDLPILPGARGLTTAEAIARAEAGLANIDTSRQRTDGDVVRQNAFTFFNVVLAGLILSLFLVGEFKDGLFVGIVVMINLTVSTLQELRATRTLRELVALTAPRATAVRDGIETPILADHVVKGDLLHLHPGDQVVADGRVVERTCEVDESLLTGESDSVRRVAGDELRSGSFCVAGDCYYLAEKVGIEAYALRLASDARVLVRRSTPLQIRFRRILRILLTATGVLAALLLISYNVDELGFAESVKAATATVTTVVPTGLLLGMTVAFAVGAVRVSRSGAIVQDINAVEALNYIDVICLDKTGTITANKLTVRGVEWSPGAETAGPWLAAFARATAGESKTAGALNDFLGSHTNGAEPGEGVPFNSERRWSALRLTLSGESRIFVLGAPETVLPMCSGGDAMLERYGEIAGHGLRGLVFAESQRLPDVGVAMSGLQPLALIMLADVLRPEVKPAFDMMRTLGVEPRLISGDNPATVAALVHQLGITLPGGTISGADLDALDETRFQAAVQRNSIFGRIAPAQKARIVQALRGQGHFVAMVGDGANDVQALRAADVAVSMASGTGTARAVAGIILLNDSFEALIRGVKEATAVLGNSARLSKLFLAKSIYAFLLIVATNMLRLDFPFLPGQGSLTALLSLGIPAVFISISIPPPDAGRDFTKNVLRFALPASLSIAAASITVHLVTDGLMGQTTEESRTLVSLVLGITGLFLVVEVLGFEGASFRSLTRPVMTTVLAAGLLAALVFTVYTPVTRDFFDFTPMGVGDWVVVAVASVCAIAGQFLISRFWPQIVNLLVARPGPADELRGRAI